MRKLFLNCILLLCALIVGSSSVFASSFTSTVNAKFAGTGDVSNKFTTTGSITSPSWSLAVTWKSSAYWGNKDGTKGNQIGSGDNPARTITLSTSSVPSGAVISSIVVNASTANSATATISCKVNNSNFGTQSQSLSTSATNYTFSGSASGAIDIIIAQPSTSKALYIKSVAVTYSIPLSAPTGFSVEGGNAQATFSWNSVTNASSYTILYTPDGGEEQTRTDITGTSVTITELTNDKEYTCRIKAVGNGTDYTTSSYSSSITVTPSASTFYNVNLSASLTNGSISRSATKAVSGATVTLTATPADGYLFTNDAEHWSVVEGGVNNITVTPGEGNTASFTMPAGDVTVNAIFTEKPTYTISKTAKNGSVSTDVSSAYEGKEVTITLTPDDDYALSSLSVIDASGESVSVSNNKFTMPGKAVRVIAIFEVRKTDVLTRETTGVTSGSTTYTTWDNKTASNSGHSDVKYAGRSAGQHGAIQLRNSDNSGIVTTTSAGVVKSITVSWNSNTAAARSISIYGKHSAYSATSELYNNDTKGSLIGTVANGTTTLPIEEDYEYIGILASGALYLDEISIAWETLVYESNDIDLSSGYDGTYYWGTFSSIYPTFFPKSAFDVKRVNSESTGTLELVSLSESTAKISSSDVDGYYVPANTGVLLKANASAPTYYVAENKSVSSIGTNLLRASTIEMEETGYLFYRLSYNEGANVDLGFYYGAVDGAPFSIGGGKAYLAIVGSNNQTAPARFLFNEEENNATTIENTNQTEQVQKFYKNGNIYIKRDGITYDMMGRIVR